MKFYYDSSYFTLFSKQIPFLKQEFASLVCQPTTRPILTSSVF